MLSGSERERPSSSAQAELRAVFQLEKDDQNMCGKVKAHSIAMKMNLNSKTMSIVWLFTLLIQLVLFVCVFFLDSEMIDR